MSSQTYSSTSYTTSSTVNGQTTGSSYSQIAQGNDQGSTVHTTSQTSGQPASTSTKTYDAQGRELLDGPGSDQGRIQDANDRKYEEAMEDEYAKREGGA